VRSQEEHKCYEWRCKNCSQFVEGLGHRCSIKTETLRPPATSLIFFDIECTQDEGEHVPNLCVAQTCCVKCINENDITKPCICGSRCPHCHSWSRKQQKHLIPPCQDTCGNREVVFRGPLAIELFCDWLFSPEHANYNVLAHYGSGYDFVFLLKQIHSRGIKHQVIYRGSKLMHVRILDKLNIRLLDSLCFLPVGLAKLPRAFGFAQEVRKGYFPHFFNKASSVGYKGPYPPVEDYGAPYMKEDSKNDFDKWYRTTEGKVFDFDAELLAYCQDDVKILRLACLKFRKLLMEVTSSEAANDVEGGQCGREVSTGFDPFNVITLAGCCMGVYKSCFYKPMPIQKADGTNVKDELGVDKKFLPIAQVPSAGYVEKQTFSKKSIQWLEFIMATETHNGQRLFVRHAKNHVDGEYKLEMGAGLADGYCEATNTVYLFHGYVYFI
jgi:hypothetical protein